MPWIAWGTHCHTGRTHWRVANGMQHAGFTFVSSLTLRIWKSENFIKSSKMSVPGFLTAPRSISCTCIWYGLTHQMFTAENVTPQKVRMTWSVVGLGTAAGPAWPCCGHWLAGRAGAGLRYWWHQWVWWVVRLGFLPHRNMLLLLHSTTASPQPNMLLLLTKLHYMHTPCTMR